MTLSIVIPAYNCAGVLEETVLSLLNAGLSDYEILIIDDGSGDDTLEVIHKLEKTDAHIRGFHQDNQGVSAARNRGIMEAAGDYILFFDADDSVDSGAYSEIVDKLRLDAPDMYLYGMTFDYYYHKKMYRRDTAVYSECKTMYISEWADSFYGLFVCNYLNPVWNKFISRRILTEHRVRFDSGIIEMEDFLFTVRCMKYCNEIYVSNKAIYHYRQDERERGNYNRLRRIGSLSAYMVPFEREISDLEAAMQKKGADLKDGRKVLDSIFCTFVRDSIRFADVNTIQKRFMDLKSNDRMELLKRNAPALYRLAEAEQWHKIWMRNLKSRIRHFIAVRVKYVLYRKNAKQRAV